MTTLNEWHRQNQNVDRFLILEVEKRRLFWTHVEQAYLMIPKEIDLVEARKFFEAHPVTPNWSTFEKCLIWLGARRATSEDYTVLHFER